MVVLIIFPISSINPIMLSIGGQGLTVLNSAFVKWIAIFSCTWR